MTVYVHPDPDRDEHLRLAQMLLERAGRLSMMAHRARVLGKTARAASLDAEAARLRQEARALVRGETPQEN